MGQKTHNAKLSPNSCFIMAWKHNASRHVVDIMIYSPAGGTKARHVSLLNLGEFGTKKDRRLSAARAVSP